MYKRIIGKEISAKILLSEGNKSGESNIYEAVDLFDPTMLASSSGEKSPETNTSAFSHPGVRSFVKRAHEFLKLYVFHYFLTYKYPCLIFLLGCPWN